MWEFETIFTHIVYIDKCGLGGGIMWLIYIDIDIDIDIAFSIGDDVGVLYWCWCWCCMTYDDIIVCVLIIELWDDIAYILCA